MENLLELGRSYLEAEGWDVRQRGRELLRGERDSRRGDGDKEHIYVWVPSDFEGSFATREGPFLRRLEEARNEHPRAEKVFLVPTTLGLSTAFVSSAAEDHAVETRVPAQFFDQNFRWENDNSAPAGSKELRDRGADLVSARIPQPFRLGTELGTGTAPDGTDLLDVLAERLRAPQAGEPNIHIVTGPAGMGKSVLFEALYARLYDEFQKDKRARRIAARPFALLPEYVPDAPSQTVESVLDSYLTKEFAQAMSRDLFNWRLVHGFGLWMMDGLDEILERDPRFFGYVEELMTLPFGETPPPVLISVRDSLLTTHRGLAAFRDEYGEHVAFYSLADWEAPSKHALARIKPRVDAAQFMSELEQEPALNRLASTPYYCDLLLDEFAAGEFGTGDSEYEIMERGVERIIAREREKKLLQEIPDAQVREFIESCAVDALTEGSVPADGLQLYAGAVVESEHATGERADRLMTQLGQAAVFARGQDGNLRFAQEPVRNHLAAEYLAGALLRDQFEVLRRYALDDDVVKPMCASLHAHGGDERARLWAEQHVDTGGILGENALRLAVRLADGTGHLKDVRLEGRDLAGMRFSRHDLVNASFLGSDLTSADLRDSDITRASFVNCIIAETRLPADPTMLASADFGDGHRFHSAYVGEDFFEEFAALSAFAEPHAPHVDESQPACPAALQLRHMFGKFVDERGHGHRMEHAARSLARGKKFVGAAVHEDLIGRAISEGYLVEIPRNQKVSRPRGDLYGEMVKFRTDLELSQGIRGVLDQTCPLRDCPHVR